MAILRRQNWAACLKVSTAFRGPQGEGLVTWLALLSLEHILGMDYEIVGSVAILLPRVLLRYPICVLCCAAMPCSVASALS
jgi:hypothetical protein